jgi:hypothetical protein
MVLNFIISSAGDNKVADALTRLGSSREQAPLGVFTCDLIKPSIPLEEESPTPVLGGPPGEDSLTPTLETDTRTPIGPVGQAREARTEIVAITGPPNSNMDWQKPISEYLWVEKIPDDETETQRLAYWAKGYLIHDVQP